MTKKIAKRKSLFATCCACMCLCVCSVTSNSLGLHELCSCYFLLQGIFLIQGSNSGLLHCRWILYCLSHHQFSSVQWLSFIWPFVTPWTVACSPPCLSPTSRVYSNSCPLSRWCPPTISSSVIPFSSCPQSSQHQGLFKWVSSSHQVAKVLEFQLQH